MNFREYEEARVRFDKITGEGKVTHAVLGLAGEAGEVANKFAQSLHSPDKFSRSAVLEEMGDVLWYLSKLAAALDSDLETVARNNIEKLVARYNEKAK